MPGGVVLHNDSLVGLVHKGSLELDGTVVVVDRLVVLVGHSEDVVLLDGTEVVVDTLVVPVGHGEGLQQEHAFSRGRRSNLSSWSSLDMFLFE